MKSRSWYTAFLAFERDNNIGITQPHCKALFSSSPLSEGRPINFLDCHHHFYDTNNEFSKFVSGFNPNASFLPDDYYRDVIEPIQMTTKIEEEDFLPYLKRRGGVNHIGSVLVENLPDDGLAEVRWLESLIGSSSSSVKAIIASCDLTNESLDTMLIQLKEASPKVRGIRWILDCVGSRSEEGNEATHIANLRHDGVDYLRDGGTEKDEVVPEFERGFALLEKYNYSFDLQCAPEQLLAAAKLCARYPNIPVVIAHLGKPMHILGGPSNSNMMPDNKSLEVWRTGMKAMAELPNVYVKISGLGWIIPGWIQSARRVDIIKNLCREVVALFGPERCMINTNWWRDAAHSDSEGYSSTGPTSVQYLDYMLQFFEDLSFEEQQQLFAGTAQRFYKIDISDEGGENI